MRILIAVQAPIPPQVSQSYSPFGWYKLGVCCWNYSGFDGAVEFINTLNFCTEPKYSNPTSFRYSLAPGLTAILTPFLEIAGTPPGITINGQVVNPATGEGMVVNPVI